MTITTEISVRNFEFWSDMLEMNPSYLAGFFTEQRLIVTGLGGLVWMGIGAGIMAKMISFEI